MIIQDAAGREVFRFDSKYAALYIGADGNEGDIIVRDGSGRQVFRFDSHTAALYLGAEGNEGDIIIRNTAGDDTFRVDGNEGDIFVKRKIDGVLREVMKFDASHAALYVGSEGNEGDIIVRDGAGRTVFHFDSHYAALYVGADGNEGDVIVRDGAGNERIRLDGNTGDIRLQGADCAEEFEVVDSSAIDPGTVLVIDDDGHLHPCEKPYDRRVAGVVSGGNNSNPGIILDSHPDRDERLPIALNGKVYCKVDATFSPVTVGDLLTTSPVLGHAMKADDHTEAFGAVIGKALRGLREGRALIPILVSLQ